MPNKTKKQKLLAEQRKRLHFLEPQPTKNVLTQQVPVVQTTSVEQKTDISYFFSDFKKSLFFIVAIIALEFVLYFVSIRYKF